MKVNPINTVNTKTNFKANIIPTESLKETFDVLQRSANSPVFKDMNYTKDFLDSLSRILESKKIAEFKIDIDKRRANHTYTKINGRRVSGGHNERIPNVQDSYLVTEGTKNFASKLEETEPTILDTLKERVEDAQKVLDEAKARYSDRIIAEFEQAKKIIFENVK